MKTVKEFKIKGENPHKSLVMLHIYIPPHMFSFKLEKELYKSSKHLNPILRTSHMLSLSLSAPLSLIP